MAVAIYARISDDDRKTEQGVERQKEDCLDLAQRRGWEVFKTYTDNDISAFKGDKLRPAYQSMLSDAKAGRFDRIIVYSQSRLWRNRGERGTDIDLLGKKLGITLTLANGEERNLGTASGRRWADMMGTSDSAESDDRSERVSRAAQQRAEQGRANSYVAYGWKRVYTSVSPKVWHDEEHPEQAPIVREIVDRLLEGESLHAIARDFNEVRVVMPPRPRHGETEGKTWNPNQLRRVATRASNVGQVVYKGKVIGDHAKAPAIVDADKHARVVALFNRRKQLHARDTKRQHLLTRGVGECGVCGGQLSARTIPDRDGSHWIYRCDTRHCIARNKEWVDAQVSQRVVRLLSQFDLPALLAGNDQEAAKAQERVAALRARKDNAATAYATGDIDIGQITIINRALDPELAAAESEMQRVTPAIVPSRASELTGPDAAAVWVSLDVRAKRAVLDALQVRVVIQRRSTGGSLFNPDDIMVGVASLSTFDLFKSALVYPVSAVERKSELDHIGAVLRTKS